MNNEITVKENQKLILPLLWTGDESHLFYNIFLAGKGAKITIPALLLGKNEGKLDLKIKIYHQKSNTKSNIIIKSALKDNANIKIDSLVKIDPHAKNSDARLISNVLLLSDKAKIQVIPGLEILEKEIKAGHAATIGRINDRELFYLMSRGLNKLQATSLIIHGFLSNILNQFPHDFAQKARKKIKNYTSEQ